jgi:hypothetical protein
MMAGDIGHLPHGGQVDTAHRQILGSAPEDFQAGRLLAHQIGHGGGRLPVIFHHQPAHARFLRQPRQIVGIDLARAAAVGTLMDMNVDHAGEGKGRILRPCRRSQ